MKNKYRPKTFCKHYDCEYLTDFAQEIYKLKFEEEPNYEYLSFLLKKNLMNKNMIPNNVFEWTQKFKPGIVKKIQKPP